MNEHIGQHFALKMQSKATSFIVIYGNAWKPGQANNELLLNSLGSKGRPAGRDYMLLRYILYSFADSTAIVNSKPKQKYKQSNFD